MTHDTHGEPIERAVTLENDPDAFRAAESDFLRAVEGMGYTEASVFALRLALEEAVVNGFKHGNREAPGLTVDLAWRVAPDRVRISVQDQGPGFEPEEVPDPRSPENLDRPSGRGIMLMRAYMTRVRYNDRGNRVEMEYERPSEG
jgi:serine/threonine-protein kinase RsbW